jgi:hypothetical protein
MSEGPAPDAIFITSASSHAGPTSQGRIYPSEPRGMMKETKSGSIRRHKSCGTCGTTTEHHPRGIYPRNSSLSRDVVARESISIVCSQIRGEANENPVEGQAADNTKSEKRPEFA